MIAPVSSSGRVFYRGPSLLDGSPIRLVGTCLDRPSNNRKTGDMSQWWILPDDKPPTLRANRRGICGGCPQEAACYINWGMAPGQVWRTDYPDYEPSRDRHLLTWKPHRYGAAGDPAGVPGAVWSPIRAAARQGHTGYTQFWRRGRFWRLRSWLMASCHTLEEATQATDKGWSPYLVMPETVPGIRVCPYESTEGAVRCSHCKLCDGKHGAIQITEHGSPAARNAWATIRKQEAQ